MQQEDKRILIELISNKQINMIIENHSLYDSDEYKKLEELKVKVKDETL